MHAKTLQEASLHGTGVALVTPFYSKTHIDFSALAQLVKVVNQSGVDYLVVHGTTGEAATTSPAEKEEIFACIQAANHKKLPIVCGFSGNHTQAMCHQLETLPAQGIAALMVATPHYNRPSQAGLLAHYTALADASPVPLLLYNIPSRTGTHMEAATVITLAGHPKIIGIKEASNELDHCVQIARSCPDFLVAGDDLMAPALISLGAVGVISVAANALPTAVVKMIRAALTGRVAKVQQVAQRLQPLLKLLFQEGNPVGIKMLLELQGHCKSLVRLPLVSGSEWLHQQLQTSWATWQQHDAPSSIQKGAHNGAPEHEQINSQRDPSS